MSPWESVIKRLITSPSGWCPLMLMFLRNVSHLLSQHIRTMEKTSRIVNRDISNFLQVHLLSIEKNAHNHANETFKVSIFQRAKHLILFFDFALVLISFPRKHGPFMRHYWKIYNNLQSSINWLLTLIPCFFSYAILHIDELHSSMIKSRSHIRWIFFENYFHLTCKKIHHDL